MASKMTSLAVIDSTNQLPVVPTNEDIAIILEEVRDMDRLPYGRIKIAAGGVTVFQVYEPGEEEPNMEQAVEGVIIMSHKSNGLWLNPFGEGGNNAPDCSSIDGIEGMNTKTGECVACDTCPYNEFGSAKGGEGRGKACKNMRRLYIMRRGDVFPMVLTLPPTALAAYDNYRTRVMLGRKKMQTVMTRITLKSSKNSDGISYATPVFEALGVLSGAEAEAIQQYTDIFTKSAQNVGVTADDAPVTVEAEGAVRDGGEAPVQAVEVEVPDVPFSEAADGYQVIE